MTLDPEFLSLLVCPMTRKPLRMATPAELGRVNATIQTGDARNRGGDPVRTALTDGLVPEGEAVVYPIVEGIPVLLVPEAIPFSSGAA
jgi:uncharacterized protein YbaR (Trm112 family)